MPSALFRDCIRMLEFAGSRGAHPMFSSLLCMCYSLWLGRNSHPMFYISVYQFMWKKGWHSHYLLVNHRLSGSHMLRRVETYTVSI